MAATVATAGLLSAVPARAAGPGEEQGAKGLFWARKGDCSKAERYLEEAEHIRHRPSWAVALADCYAARGELLRASAIYRQVAAEKPVRGWGRPDYNARKAASGKAADVDARIPTLKIWIAGDAPGAEVEVDGKRVDDRDAELRFLPGAQVHVVARAKGRRDAEETVVLQERERRVLELELAPLAPMQPPSTIGAPPKSWIGARYYGVVIPRFVMNLVADGGTNLLVPGGAFTYTMPAGSAELTLALGYLSYRMGDTPFKPHGEPDTEWEYVGSSLQAFTASVEMMWGFRLDAHDRVRFRVGGALGFGWMALGDMTRVQSYPANGKPGDPSTYLKCRGPNNPMGTYAYCNAYDKDANHYPGYTEPDWFHGGIRPSVFPWLVIPQLGLSFRPARAVAIDLDTGVSISGFLTSLGVRVGL